MPNNVVHNCQSSYKFGWPKCEQHMCTIFASCTGLVFIFFNDIWFKIGGSRVGLCGNNQQSTKLEILQWGHCITVFSHVINKANNGWPNIDWHMYLVMHKLLILWPIITHNMTHNLDLIDLISAKLVGKKYWLLAHIGP